MPPFLGSHKAVFSLGLSNSLVCYQLGPQLVNLCRCDWIAKVFSSSVGLPTDEFLGKRTIRRWEPGWSNECLWRGHGSPETLSIPLVWNKQPCSITPSHHSPAPLHRHRNKTEAAKHGSQPLKLQIKTNPASAELFCSGVSFHGDGTFKQRKLVAKVGSLLFLCLIIQLRSLWDWFAGGVWNRLERWA